ncbi:MAG TPA: 2-oxoacid:acceptor oxidoreductase family protein [Burkholderiales bacterium]|nr:2-oxoacid:acceptor oxidoreductase family protein [Burkholderiales bacterium]
MFRVRFHGRGGQGAKTASQILSSALFLEGFEVQDAPRYGAERRGAAMFAYVRAARAPIQERGVIARPDLVVAIDDTLATMPAAAVLQGVAQDTVVLIQSAEPAEAWRPRLNAPCELLVLAPPPGAAAQAEAPFGGVRCAGAAARLLGVVGRASLERALEAELAGLGERLIEQNRAHALAGFDALAPHAGRVRGDAPRAAEAPPDWIAVPLDDAAIAAPDIHATGTSAASPTGLWRVLRPVIDYEHCKRCVWVCGTYCPDSAIRAGEDGRPNIDYDHCKGCMVCVTVCPPHAIHAVPEREAA